MLLDDVRHALRLRRGLVADAVHAGDEGDRVGFEIPLGVEGDLLVSRVVVTHVVGRAGAVGGGVPAQVRAGVGIQIQGDLVIVAVELRVRILLGDIIPVGVEGDGELIGQAGDVAGEFADGGIRLRILVVAGIGGIDDEDGVGLRVLVDGIQRHGELAPGDVLALVGAVDAVSDVDHLAGRQLHGIRAQHVVLTVEILLGEGHGLVEGEAAALVEPQGVGEGAGAAAEDAADVEEGKLALEAHGGHGDLLAVVGLVRGKGRLFDLNAHLGILGGDQGVLGDGGGDVEVGVAAVDDAGPAVKDVALHQGTADGPGSPAVGHVLGIDDGKSGAVLRLDAFAVADQPGLRLVPGLLHGHPFAVHGVVGVVQLAVGADGDDQALVHGGGGAAVGAGVLRVGGAARGDVGELDLRSAVLLRGDLAGLSILRGGVDHGFAGEGGDVVVVVKVAVVMTPEHDDLMTGIDGRVQHADDLRGMLHGADVRPIVEGVVGQDEDGNAGGGGAEIFLQALDIVGIIVIDVVHGALAGAEAVDDVLVGLHPFADAQELLCRRLLILHRVVAAGGGEPFVVAEGVNGIADLPGRDLAGDVVHDHLGPGPVIIHAGIGGAHVAAEAEGVDIAHAGGLQPGLQVEIIAAVMVDVGGEGQGDGAVGIRHGAALHGRDVAAVGDVAPAAGEGGALENKDRRRAVRRAGLAEGLPFRVKGHVVGAVVQADLLGAAVIHEGAAVAAGGVVDHEAAGAAEDGVARNGGALQHLIVGVMPGRGAAGSDGAFTVGHGDGAQVAVIAEGVILFSHSCRDDVVLSRRQVRDLAEDGGLDVEVQGAGLGGVGGHAEGAAVESQIADDGVGVALQGQNAVFIPDDAGLRIDPKAARKAQVVAAVALTAQLFLQITVLGNVPHGGIAREGDGAVGGNVHGLRENGAAVGAEGEAVLARLGHEEGRGADAGFIRVLSLFKDIGLGVGRFRPDGVEGQGPVRADGLVGEDAAHGIGGSGPVGLGVPAREGVASPGGAFGDGVVLALGLDGRGGRHVGGVAVEGESILLRCGDELEEQDLRCGVGRGEAAAAEGQVGSPDLERAVRIGHVAPDGAAAGEAAPRVGPAGALSQGSHEAALGADRGRSSAAAAVHGVVAVAGLPDDIIRRALLQGVGEGTHVGGAEEQDLCGARRGRIRLDVAELAAAEADPAVGAAGGKVENVLLRVILKDAAAGIGHAAGIGVNVGAGGGGGLEMIAVVQSPDRDLGVLRREGGVVPVHGDLEGVSVRAVKNEGVVFVPRLGDDDIVPVRRQFVVPGEVGKGQIGVLFPDGVEGEIFICEDEVADLVENAAAVGLGVPALEDPADLGEGLGDLIVLTLRLGAGHGVQALHVGLEGDGVLHGEGGHRVDRDGGAAVVAQGERGPVAGQRIIVSAVVVPYIVDLVLRVVVARAVALVIHLKAASAPEGEAGERGALEQTGIGRKPDHLPIRRDAADVAVGVEGDRCSIDGAAVIC